MKTFRNLLVLVLALTMVLSLAACDGSEDEAGITPRPTPKLYTVDISAEELNNYYVAYTVTKSGEMVQDESGNYVEKKDATNFVEIGYSSIVLSSENGGETFVAGSTQCFNSTADISTQPKSLFSVHMNYEDAKKEGKLENKGTETVAGKDCTHYYYKNGLMEVHMYVDESFGSTGMCLKYEAVGYMPQTIEVTELKFGVINTEEGYEFVNYQTKVATPEPVEEAPAA